jgi:hypothetical protein
MFFQENLKAFHEGRAEKDPSTYWYKGELGFFDFYIIPLAKKLKECGVFGVSSDEYLTYAENNRKQWEDMGEEVVAEMAVKYQPSLNEDEDLDDVIEETSHSGSSATGSSHLDMPQESIIDVNETWEMLRRIPNYEKRAGTILFQQ